MPFIYIDNIPIENLVLRKKIETLLGPLVYDLVKGPLDVQSSREWEESASLFLSLVPTQIKRENQSIH